MADKRYEDETSRAKGAENELPEVKSAVDDDGQYNVQYVDLDGDDIDTLYVHLPEHPGRGTAGCVRKKIHLHELLSDYNLPMIFLDFDENEILIGIEVLV